MDDTKLGRFVHRLARYVAIAGGLVLTAIVAITVLSVVGRAFIWAGLSGIAGDYELVEAGVGFAIFAFLPWTHLTRGHAVVSIFTDFLSARANAWIMVVSDALMLAIAAFIAWRHLLGTVDKFNYGETTLLLRMPLWWAYAAGLVGAVALVIAAAYVLARSVRDALSDNPPHPTQGMVH
ncbi:TRAP transporter small permease [Allomesorhizobium camelthorni]|uniref:TRAP transporter small permease protein n=1 Tax=Allomesorhizobium camelthorni TaxID=475069 RepID=A0A6G4WK80_9HYPH|nr:TRAP transporter small permease [Mesorhizobium camelthorni]NGO55215.1 TRAP transporter small permease [Mesorhizobium camelthorni]